MSKYTKDSLLQVGEKVTDEQLATEMKLLMNQRIMNRVSRRNFLAGAGMSVGAAGALVIAGCGSNSSTTATTTTPVTTAPAAGAPTELDVLNFALNLEYLEATFYLYITTGNGLSTADMGTSPGAVTGGAKVAFTDPNVTALAQQLAADEQAHVEFIRSLITGAGGTPVGMPALNLAALGTVNSDATFLAMARQLETVGTSAYEGGIQYFVSDLTGLAYAATIHDTEGQHEGALRQFCIAKGITSAAVDASDIAVSGASGPVFNTDMNGLNAVRTPSQVLQIVYGAAGQTGVSKGGFYPNGMNGTITTS